MNDSTSTSPREPYCMDCRATDCGCYDMVGHAYDVAFDAMWTHAQMMQDIILITFVDLAKDCLKSDDEHIVDRAKAAMTEALAYFMRAQQKGA